MITETRSDQEIRYDEPFDEYRDRSALNNSTIHRILTQSPADARRAMIDPPKASDAMVESRRMHEALLEPELFAASYAVLPDLTQGIKTKDGQDAKNPRATQEYKERLARWQQDNHGKIPLTQAEFELIIRCRAIASSLTDPRDGRPEVSIYWQDQNVDVQWKGRIDLLWGSTIVDFKFVADTSRFGVDLFYAGYHRQMALYRRGLRALGVQVDQCLLVAVEKTGIGDHAVMAPLSEDALQLGEREIDKAVSMWLDCVAFDHFHGYLSPHEFGVPDNYKSPF